MIQRKQSLWLLLAALLSAGVFYFDLYRYHTIINATDVPGQIRVANDYVALLIALVMTALPFVTIFMFRNRKRQVNMALLSILATLSFVGLVILRVANLNKSAPPPANTSYWIGAVLPIIALVFLIMAIAGIRKDEKLVKSADRLR